MGRALTGIPPPHGPEHDTDPPRDPALPARNYVVCSTPRSGSGLLTRALVASDVAGTPTEYFNANDRAALTRRWGCGSDLRAYARTLRARRTTEDGVFGTKLHWEQLQQVRAELLGLPPGDPGFDVDAAFLSELLPAPAYVHILRRDVDRQAISTWVAAHTQVFSVARSGDAGATAKVPYSFAGVERCRRRIVASELHWDRFFRRNAITPLDVVYEDLAAGYEPAVRRVLAHVVPEAPPAEIAPPVSRSQSDERSEELLERFRHDLLRRPPSHELSLLGRVGRRLRR